MAKERLIGVVDDDESVREALLELLRELGFVARAFFSAREFLASDYLDRVECLILDVAMPGLSGPGLHREIKARGKRIPIIFITAHGNESTRAGLLEQGAEECLLKPFNDIDLREALDTVFRVP